MKLIAHALSFSIACFFALSPSLHAGSPIEPPSKAVTETDFPFVRGAHELEIGLGAFWSIFTNGSANEPDTAFGLAQVSHGWMLSDVGGSGVLRGNCELLLGIFGGPIWEGPGDGLAGAEFLLRYNFVQPGARLVPFFQLGAGVAYSDASSDDEVQKLIGEEWSYALDTAVGVRWMFSPHCALMVKAEYRHFSNADRAERNRGLNSIGGVVGVSWFF